LTRIAIAIEVNRPYLPPPKALKLKSAALLAALTAGKHRERAERQTNRNWKFENPEPSGIDKRWVNG
jgi:hypothetical protein